MALLMLQTNEKVNTTLNVAYIYVFCLPGGWHESRYKCGALRIRRHFIEELWEQSAMLPEDEWRELARQRLIDFEDQLHEAFSAGLTSYTGKRTWGFWDAVAFSMTTVSTIGKLFFQVFCFHKMWIPLIMFFFSFQVMVI